MVSDLRQGELSVARLGELWSESQTELFGDSVELTGQHRPPRVRERNEAPEDVALCSA